MVHTIITFLPFLTCLFWIILYPLIARHTRSFLKMELFLAAAGISALAATNVLNGICNTSTLVYFLLEQFVAPMVIPLSLIYLNSSDKDSQSKVLSSLGWVSIPFSLLFAEIILLMLSGTDAFKSFIGTLMEGCSLSMLDNKIEQIIYLCSVWIFAGFIALETVLFLIRTIKMSADRTFIIQNWAFTILFLLSDGLLFTYLASDCKSGLAIELFAVLMSVSVFIVAYSGLFENRESLTIKDLLNGPETTLAVPEEIEETETAEEPDDMEDAPIRNSDDLIRKLRSAGTVTDSEDNEESESAPAMSAEYEDSLRIRFEDLVISEQLFLQKGLKISDIATRLSTNRTYISRLVNNTYDMSFSDYINTLRIDYAEQYLIHNRGAKQTDIAEACGFPNASSFNNIFKKITGVTPKIWLATRS